MFIKFILHPVVLLHSPGLFFKSNTRIQRASTIYMYIHSVFIRSLVIIKPFLTINTPFLNPNFGVIKFFAHHNPVSLSYAQGVDQKIFNEIKHFNGHVLAQVRNLQFLQNLPSSSLPSISYAELSLVTLTIHLCRLLRIFQES